MTALVFENLAALPVQLDSLRTLLVRLARAIDALVKARAARAVPEWRIRQVTLSSPVHRQRLPARSIDRH